MKRSVARRRTSLTLSMISKEIVRSVFQENNSEEKRYNVRLVRDDNILSLSRERKTLIER
jgi:hypothetical protein